MPAHSDVTGAVERQLLLQLGQRLKLARRSHGMALAELARRVGISRTTLHAVEAGEPSPTMGTYVRVLSALGLAVDLALVGTGESLARNQSEIFSMELGGHVPQDLLSMMLHKEAVKLLRRRPLLVEKAKATLKRWRDTGDAHSMPLWNEWARILEKSDWKRVLANTEGAKQLRQASPLSPLVPAPIRSRIISEVRALRRGQLRSQGGSSVQQEHWEHDHATA